MKFVKLLGLAILVCSYVQTVGQLKEDKVISSIGFGSCAHQLKAQPVLRLVTQKNPDLFIYLGDNIYGNTSKARCLEKKYRRLSRKAEFQLLTNSTEVLATWDDHDYGKNDAGRHFSLKEESREIFLDFWKEPQHSERRQHPGIYHSQLYGPMDKRIQIILLDTRTFRDDLVKNDKSGAFKNDYRPNPIPDSTFLGEQQWQWFEEQLKIPAQLRIIASSNQFAHEYNGWESWTNVPHERDRMLDMIRRNKASGVIFLSGDVHWGELSRLNAEGLYPIYDVTSSGITQRWSGTEPNSNRIGDVVRQNNYGLIDIDWSPDDPKIVLSIFDKEDALRVQHKIQLSDIEFE